MLTEAKQTIGFAVLTVAAFTSTVALEPSSPFGMVAATGAGVALGLTFLCGSHWLRERHCQRVATALHDATHGGTR
ncbi:hypothetical protein AB0B63_07325 [Micromonospora sp. NPDC049081]|uniref:hypothetical protein n=1 Tax=Micromonospora sp. NPDC049081 TaxID=3155150 RepID=UPI0033E0C07F